MKKPSIILKRKGSVVKIRVSKPSAKKVKAATPVAEYIPRMRRSDRIKEGLAVQAAIQAPERGQLRKWQWEQRGDLLRIVKGVGYVGAEELSLTALEEVVEGIRRCQIMRLMAA